mmetsp:Transcript_69472/g.125253  ORF Transcript_69472/g.125253 Transcript_69472/m.125253 type:complete len:286 (-) Transcript_69472:134-991(-)
MGNKNSAINTKLQAKEWQWQLKTEVKTLDREIKKIQVDEAKLQREIHDQAEKGNVDAVQMLARSVVRSRKAVQRLEKTKASMHAVNLQLTTSIATMSTTSSIRLSADIMRKMNGIARIPEVSGTMEAMRREMARCAEAEDAIEDALRDESEEVEASSEVQKLLEEMALDQMGPLARAKSASAGAPAVPVAPVAAASAAERIPIAEGGFAPAPRPAAQVPAAASSVPAPAAAPASASAKESPSTAPSVAEAAVPAASPAASAAAAAAGAASPEDDLMRRLEMLKRP